MSVLVAFDRGRQRLLTVLEIGRPGLEDPGLETRKAWIPVSVQVLTSPLAERLGLAGRTGVRITRVLGESASSAGLRVGDVITAIDDNPIEASQPSDEDLFATMIRQYKIGSSVQLGVVRDGKEQKVAVKLDQSPRLPREMKKYRGSELRVPGARRQRGRSGGKVLEGRGARGARRGRARGWLGGSRPARRW